jgi:hypothetical protein
VRSLVRRSLKSSWQQLGDDIDGQGFFADTGYTVSASDDGLSIAVGSPALDAYFGAGFVEVFDLNGVDWQQRGGFIKSDASTVSAIATTALEHQPRSLATEMSSVSELLLVTSVDNKTRESQVCMNG